MSATTPEATPNSPEALHPQALQTSRGPEADKAEPQTPWHKKLLRRVKEWQPLVALLSFVLGVFVGFIAFLGFTTDRINESVENSLRSEEYREELAGLVRPSLIFDLQGHFVDDDGAAQYIKSWVADVDT